LQKAKSVLEDVAQGAASGSNLIVRNAEGWLRPAVEVGGAALHGLVPVLLDVIKHGPDALHEIAVRLARRLGLLQEEHHVAASLVV